MTARLFKRTASLTLARQPSSGFFRTLPNAIVIRDLRIQFTIEKNLEPDPNTAEITISNLSQDSRAWLQQKPLHVRLDAGHDGEPRRLFVGDMRWSQSKREKVDWETRIQAGDGDRAHQHGRLNQSFRSGVNVGTVIGQLAKAHGLSIPTSAADAVAFGQQMASGVSVSGPTHRELTRILRPRGLEWSVQDGKLQILERNGVRPDRAFVVSQDTGMIGTPELAAPTEKGQPPILHISTLLDGRILPGSKISVKSRLINGLYRVNRVRHVGDTRGQEWATEMEAQATT